jgi:hypothetical protein
MEDLLVKLLIICEFREGVWSEGHTSRTSVNEILPDFLNCRQFL